ncbi:MAG: endolytic transglycosylase MltG [Angustibacter sp.]
MPDRNSQHQHVDLGAVLADHDDSGHPMAHDDVPRFSSRAERRHHDAHRRRRRRRRGRRSVVLLVAAVLVIGGALGAVFALRPIVNQLTAPDDYTGSGTGSVTVTIASGASGRSIGRTLEQAGVVKSAKAFVSAAAENPKAGSIQPGQYELRRQMSAASAIALLLDPSSRSADRVTIREGLRATEIVAALSKATGVPVADYTAALKDPAALGVPAAAKGKVEGWLFPDTYEFGTDLTAEQQLSRMVAHTHDVLDGLGVSDAQAMKVLTIASLVEAEAASPEDYAKVARVIDNRLANQLHNGARLQLDSTVSYAVGKRTITTTAGERNVDSPYNTYRYGGLPPGPINNPGKAAIAGALNPTPGPWLYFVTVDPSTGETKFATTSAEHQRNVAEFRQWCRDNPGKC